MLEIVFEEADTSIQKSYYEGYKQANVELLPQIEYYKYQLENTQQSKITNYITTATISFAIGCIVGGTIGFNLQFKL